MIKKIPYQRRTIVRGRPISSVTPSLIFSLLNQRATQVLIGLFYSVMVRVYCESIYIYEAISSGTVSRIFSLLNQRATQVLIGLFYSIMVRASILIGFF